MKQNLSYLIVVVLMSCATASNAQPSKSHIAGDSVKTGIAEVNDIRMYYEIRGKGEPLILLHGGLGNTSNWKKQFGPLAEHFTVYAVDSRGHGRTNFTEKEISYEQLASDVIAFMDRMKIGKAHIVGWSDGAIVGLILAIRHPLRLKKLVAFGANFDPSGVRPGVEDNPKIKEHIEHAAADYKRLSPNPNRWDPFFANMTKMWATEPKLTLSELSSINVPSLIIDGEADEAILTEHIKKLASYIPKARLVLISGTGHFAHKEKADEFNRHVKLFLSQ